jgi:RNA polymerase sigma-70 factor (TIGR02960 family)
VAQVSTDLIAQARAGDGEAFGRLVEPYRRELQVHCYRILGSVAAAEDALQETLLSAWQGLAGFEGRASIRTWLYQVATSRSLNALRSARRRPELDWPPAGTDPPAPTRLGEVVWLEPYPDVLLEGLADSAPGPDARYEATEAISLAFITALQLLPPRQRAVLILRDVLGFHAREVAQILGSSEESVTSALKRARASLQRQFPPEGQDPPPPPHSAVEQELIERLTRAYQTGDVNGLVALLTDDVKLAMPPVPLEYQGRDLAAQFLAATAFRPGRTWRLAATRANGQPAFGAYVRDPRTGVAHAAGLHVFTLAGDRICGITRFDNSVLPRFGLPRALPS